MPLRYAPGKEGVRHVGLQPLDFVLFANVSVKPELELYNPRHGSKVYA